MEERKKIEKRLKDLKMKVSAFFIFPLIMIIFGKILIQENVVPLVKNYEDERMKIIQAFLYFLGLGVFFFCGGFSDFISKKIFFNKNSLEEKMDGYYAYTILMFCFLELITISGFAGFLICGNFAWLGTFAIINFFSLFPYFPTEKRFSQKIEKF